MVKDYLAYQCKKCFRYFMSQSTKPKCIYCRSGICELKLSREKPGVVSQYISQQNYNAHKKQNN